MWQTGRFFLDLLVSLKLLTLLRYRTVNVPKAMTTCLRVFSSLNQAFLILKSLQLLETERFKCSQTLEEAKNDVYRPQRNGDQFLISQWINNSKKIIKNILKNIANIPFTHNMRQILQTKARERRRPPSTPTNQQPHQG